MALIVNTIKYLTQPEHCFALVRKLYYQRKYQNGLNVGLFSKLTDVHLGKNVFLGKNVYLTKTTIKDYSYVNDCTIIRNTTIGKFCSIGSGVTVSLGQHPVNFVSTSPMFYANNKRFQTFADKMYFKETGDRISVGNDVWVGKHVTVMDGVKIGDGAVIAADSVVTKDIAPYAVVGGVPAKLIRYRFEPEIIEQLLAIKWWNLDRSFFKKHYRQFHNIQSFLTFFADENSSTFHSD